MRRIKLLVATMLLSGLFTAGYGQQQPTQTQLQTQTGAPQAFKYQAIARNTNGDAIANQNVSFRISILEGSANGTTIYQETQTATTNQFGLANLSIGTGTVTNGTFNAIQWGNNTYFVKVEFDPKGGSDYAFMGTTQMLSVPYSLYSEHAKTADNLQNFPVKAALQGTNLQAPFDSPQTGMLVYNTDSAGSGFYSVVPGYYYNAGTAGAPNWVLLSGIVKNIPLDRALATGANVTTYGGLSQDGSGVGSGNVVSNPSGANNTGFGTDVFGGNASTNPTTGTDNTGVGYDVLSTNSVGTYNTAEGSQAMKNNTYSSDNVAVGYEALYSQTFTNLNAIYYSQNTAVGIEALFTNNPTNSGNANFNTGIGAYALTANTYGNENSANGADALYLNTTGSDNVANGFGALYGNGTGNYNVANGVDALANNNANDNTANGYYALSSNTSGSDNTADGWEALYYTETGDWNTATGRSALYGASGSSYSACTADGYAALYNNTANNNTATGYEALFYNTTATDNTANGYDALFNNTGADNTAIGYQALKTNTSGYENTTIGSGADVSSNNLFNAAAFGYLAKVASNNCLVLGSTSSNSVHVGIGTTLSSPTAALDVADGNSSDASINCHIKSEGGLPTLAITTAKGITGKALATNSTDTKGEIDLTGTSTGTGVAPTQITFTYNKSYGTGSVPTVVITPYATSGNACYNYLWFISSSTATSFVLNIYVAAPGGAAGANPSFFYHVIE